MKVDKINDIHIGSPRERVIIRCLVNLNVYGFRPIKLIIIRDRKIVETIDDEPFSMFVYVRES